MWRIRKQRDDEPRHHAYTQTIAVSFNEFAFEMAIPVLLQRARVASPE